MKIQFSQKIGSAGLLETNIFLFGLWDCFLGSAFKDKNLSIENFCFVFIMYIFKVKLK